MVEELSNLSTPLEAGASSKVGLRFCSLGFASKSEFKFRKTQKNMSTLALCMLFLLSAAVA